MNEWKLPEGMAEEDAKQFAGFVYVITRKSTGRRYIGKKYLADKRGKESKWRTYWGSSKSLLAEIESVGLGDYQKEILTFYTSRKDTDYGELKLQFGLDVLTAKLPDGSPAFYNTTIMGQWFKAKGWQHLPETRERMSAAHMGKRLDEKTRRKIATSHSRSNLTKKLFNDDQIRSIRDSQESETTLAKRFGCSKSVIGKIRRRERYRHVEDLA